MVIVVRYNEAKEKLHNMLWRYDKNRDCRLSWKELKEAFKMLGIFFPGYRAYKALHYADDNGDGYISEDEMDGLVNYVFKLRELITVDQLEAMIRRYDKDCRLSKQQLKDLFKLLGASFPSYRAHKALSYADLNGDGYISASEEFVELVNYIFKLGYLIY